MTDRGACFSLSDTNHSHRLCGCAGLVRKGNATSLHLPHNLTKPLNVFFGSPTQWLAERKYTLSLTARGMRGLVEGFWFADCRISKTSLQLDTSHTLPLHQRTTSNRDHKSKGNRLDKKVYAIKTGQQRLMYPRQSVHIIIRIESSFHTPLLSFSNICL